MNCYEFSKECLYEVIIVGGGTCSLAAAARLCEDHPGSIYTEDEHQRFHWLSQRGNRVNLINRNVSSKTKYKPMNQYKPKRRYSPEEILVLDAVSDNWLGQWDRQFAACKIPYLRSPMFFHPDPANVDGMVSYAHLQKREGPKDLMEIVNVVGKEYSKHQQKKQRQKTKRSRQTPIPNGSATSHDIGGLTDVNMRDWKDYYRPSTPFFRDFCQDIVDRYNLHDVVKKDSVVSVEYCLLNIIETNESGKGFVVKTASGQVYCCKSCIVSSGHSGEINYPIENLNVNPTNLEGSCHTTHIFSGEVSQHPHPRVVSKVARGKPTKLVVIGGGLTSAQLVEVALQSGVEKCYLMLRGPLRIKHFDFHLEWVTKYKNVKKSSFYMLDTDEERYQMIQDARQGGSVNPEYYKKLMKHVKNGRLEILRYSKLEESKWDPLKKTWDLDVSVRASKNNIELFDENGCSMSSIVSLNDVDYVYCATGICPNLHKLKFLSPILQANPIKIIQGLPVLTDNLQWDEEIPLFMTGKNASLKMGPASANLDGARLGAERIGWCLQEMRSSGAFEWEQAPGECTINDCPVCDDESESLDEGSLLSGTSVDTEDTVLSSFDTRLKLAGGELNWYSLLDVE
ncbi:hypothetical protein CAAN1_32S00518 [[Candida] anglica]|uniref:L-ornithine N(5)-monooxygenase n=1 Tax=[Candida] anglica TaxID=148631 RepID=A0ABP0EEV0_9ASCO